MILNIITPLTRPDNLPAILNSIKNIPATVHVYWWIVVDHTLVPEYRNIVDIVSDRPAENIDVIFLPNLNPLNVAGHGSRNIVLEILEHDNKSDEWVYNLDDDNVIHPKFCQFLQSLTQSEVMIPNIKDVLIFGQAFPDGKPRLYAHENYVKVGHIDTAMFLIRVSAIKGVRFPNDNYCGDGLFMEQVVSTPQRIQCYQSVFCWYNALDNESIRNIYSKNQEYEKQP